MIPKKLYISETEIDVFDEDTDIIRAWVANRPNTGRREYTDLSQVWHDAMEEPKADSLILYESIYNDILLRRYTQRESSMKTIIKWAYIEDLLPKGGE